MIDADAVGISYFNPFPTGKLRLAAPHGNEAKEAFAILQRCSLGPCFPIQSPVLVILTSRDGLPGCQMVVIIALPDRETGKPLEVRFGHSLPPLSFGPFAIAEYFLRALETIVLHEVHESVRFDGQLVKDPHAKEFAVRIELEKA